jgi:para-nitrobenzyl esterase
MDEKNSFVLNVWTPDLDDEKKRPVLLWIHGGGFASGSADMDVIFDGASLAKKGDVVVVSVNHRLNILGFCDLSALGEKYAQSGNVGMLDLVESLKWINRNIKNFGGDESNVTIFGESGGGGKVGTLMCMPSAKGLFHKAIIMSGTLINIMTQEKSQSIGLALLEEFGLTPDEVDKLNDIPYEKLVAAGDSACAKTVGIRQVGSGIVFGFNPTVDGEVLLQQPFSPGFSQISSDIPLIIGTTYNELIRNSYGQKDLTIEQARERLLKSYGEKTDEYIALFGKAYPDFTPQDLVSIDTVFRPNTIIAADAAAVEKIAPVFSYLFGWKSPVNDGTRGSFHGLELAFVFNNIDLSESSTGQGPEAYDLADKMSSVWINFAKTGNPNVPGKLPEWEPYTTENGSTMYFDNTCEIKHNHDRELMALIKASNNRK